MRGSVKPFEHPQQVYQHFSLPAFDRDQEPDLEAGSSIKSGKFAVPGDSILFSKLNPRIPRIWLPGDAKNDLPQIASTEFLVCVARNGWSRSYAYCLMSQAKFVERLTKQATGTSNSHQRIRPAQFEDVAIPIPPEEYRQAFDNLGSHLLARVVRNREERRHTLLSSRHTTPKTDLRRVGSARSGGPGSKRGTRWRMRHTHSA